MRTQSLGIDHNNERNELLVGMKELRYNDTKHRGGLESLHPTLPLGDLLFFVRSADLKTLARHMAHGTVSQLLDADRGTLVPASPWNELTPRSQAQRCQHAGYRKHRHSHVSMRLFIPYFCFQATSLYCAHGSFDAARLSKIRSPPSPKYPCSAQLFKSPRLNGPKTWISGSTGVPASLAAAPR